MYKFKNVKKLLIEFSRGEGLSVPTDSIKFVKVDGDELSGATSGGSSGDVTVKSLMASVIGRIDQYSECVVPDAYYVEDDSDNLVILDNIEDLLSIAAEGPLMFVLIPTYSSDSFSDTGTYIAPNWNTVSGTVNFEPVSVGSEYYTASSEIIQ